MILSTARPEPARPRHRHGPLPRLVHRPRLRRLALAAACCLWQALPAAAASVNWTGGAPIFYWYDPNNLFNPRGEVADALDCAGINNSGTLRCDTLSFWGYAGNWGGALPGAGDDVHIDSAAQVDVELWNSPIRGGTTPTTAATFASISQGGGGSLYIDVGGSLHTVAASIDQLRLGGQIIIDGAATINQLVNTSGGVYATTGVLRGNGSTTVHSGSGFGVADAQHVTLDGNMPLGAQVTLYDDAVLINRGNITGGLTVRNYGSTHGGNGYSALRAFQNLGTLSVATANGPGPQIEIDTQFFNQGAVQLGLDGHLYSMAGGSHGGTASFSGGAQATMQFAGFHSFAAGSAVTSDGAVAFGGASVSDLPVAPYSDAYGFHNQVSGSYRAASTLVLNNTVFDGPADPGALTASALAVFLAPAPLTLPSVTLNNGALIGVPAISVGGSVQVHSSSALGTLGGVRALAGIAFDGSGTKVIGDYHEASSWVANMGVATLSGGPLQLALQATFINAAGASFDLQGDFNILGSTGPNGAALGHFDNAGSFVKSAGNGVATVTAEFNNSGSVQVNAGTLRLLGGGTQTGTFAAASLIQLGGAQVFLADTTLGPNIGFYGPASLTVAHGVTLTNQSQSLYQQNPVGGALALVNNGTFVNAAGAFLEEGVAVTNAGSLVNAGNLHAGAFVNTGSLVSIGALLADAIGNSGSITSSGDLIANGLANQGGSFTIAASPRSTSISRIVNLAQISNAGDLHADTLSNAAAASFVNSGTFTLGYAGQAASHVNQGSLINSGGFMLAGGTLHPGTFVNDGQLLNSGGTLWMGSTETLGGQGSLTQVGGLTRVDGSLAQAGGLWLQGGTLAGQGTVNADVHVSGSGRITPGNSAGTLTINGNLVVEGVPYYASTPALVFVVVDAQVHDRLLVHGSASFGTAGWNAGAQLLWQGSAAPDLDDSFVLLSASGGVSGVDALSFSISGLGAEWQAQASNDGGTLSLAFANALAYQIQGPGNYGGENNGTLAIATSDYAFNLVNGFLNTGEIDNEGRLYNRVGAVLYNAGLIRNASTGTVQNRGALVNTGSIDNAGTFLNPADGTLTNGNGFDYTGSGYANPQVRNRAGGQMSNDGHWVNKAYATLLNQGRFVNTGSLENHGLVNNDGGNFLVAAAGTVSGDGVYLHGNGATTTVDGRLFAGFIGLEGGTLQGTGTLKAEGLSRLFQNWYGQGVAVAGVNIVPGSGGLGRLNMEGDLTAVGGNASTLTIALGAGGQSSQLAVSGQLSFWGNVVFDLVGGALPQLGTRYTWLTAASGGFGFGEVSLYSLAADGSSTLLAGPFWQWVGQDDHRGYLSFNVGGKQEYAVWNLDGSSATLSFTDTLVPVPEPAPWLLWAGGLGALVGGAARRRRGRGTIAAEPHRA